MSIASSGLEQLRVAGHEALHAKPFAALGFHRAGVGALEIDDALVQREVVHARAQRVPAALGRGEIDGQLKAKAVIGLAELEGLAAALEVDDAQIVRRAVAPFVDAVDASLQHAAAGQRQRPLAVLAAKALLQRGGVEAAAAHVLGQHRGAHPCRGLQPPALGQRHGAVAQRAGGAHRVQQKVAHRVHARSGGLGGQLAQIVHGAQQKFVDRAVEEGALVLRVQLEGIHALGLETILSKKREGTRREALQPGDAQRPERAVERPGGGGGERVGALGTGQCLTQPH